MGQLLQLGGMETTDVAMGQLNGLLQGFADEAFSLLQLLLGHRQRLQSHVVEALLVVHDGLIALVLHALKHFAYRSGELREVHGWPFHHFRQHLICDRIYT